LDTEQLIETSTTVKAVETQKKKPASNGKQKVAATDEAKILKPKKRAAVKTVVKTVPGATPAKTKKALDAKATKAAKQVKTVSTKPKPATPKKPSKS
jgi:hypothetical protein